MIGDILSLIFGGGDENYEPTKDEYLFFWVTVAMMAILAFGLSV